MVNFGKNCVLRDDMIDLLQLYDVCLLQDLHCKVLSRLLVPAQPHTSEGAWNSLQPYSLPVPNVVVSS